MNLKQHLQLKLAHCNHNDVVQLMGYTKSRRRKAVVRLEAVLSDPCVGLTTGAFDFKFSNDQFLVALCEVLGINPNEYQHEVDAIHDEHTNRRERYKSYVFIDTGFKRTTQPIFALAFCENQRFLRLDYELRIKPLHEQVEYVQKLVKNHYKENKGEIGIWGSIQRYIFNYDDDCSIALSNDGVILEDEPKISVSRAELSVGGKDITKLLGGSNNS